ncbi:uncharacterized protein METZ01_LOCUS71854 [marine metagenome]|uniref:FlgD/Vpr Ig-like domain-containing protein n=1 Tax=marine metagenome TaxID=408172 RepID=A0A381TSJ7_9ZZZZ
MKAINKRTIRMISIYLLLIPFALMKADVVERSGSRDLLDTLSLEYDDSVGINIYPGDVIMEIYRVPADLTLNQVGINIGQWNTNGETAKLQVEVFKQGASSYPYRSDGSLYPYEQEGQNSWLGYAHTETDPSTPYPSVSSGSENLVWNNFNSGAGPCNSLAEQDLGQSIFGDKVLPVGDDSTIVQTPSNLSSGFHYADFSVEGGANFLQDEYIAVVITYIGDSNGSTDEGSLITVSGQRSTYWYYGLFVHPAPGLKYYHSNCSGPSSEQGWYIDDKTPSLNYVANITGTMPPKIEILHVGISSIEPIQEYIPPGTYIRITIRINDAIVELMENVQVVLHWQVNSLDASENVLLQQASCFNLVEQQYHYCAKIEQYYSSGTRIYWWVTAEDEDGNIATTTKKSFMFGTLSVDDETIPSAFNLQGNYPNPFNPTTKINFSVQSPSEMDLTVYAMDGKLVRKILIGNVGTGYHSISWDGKDQSLNSVSSGIYFYRLDAGAQSQTGKMTLLK